MRQYLRENPHKCYCGHGGNDSGRLRNDVFALNIFLTFSYADRSQMNNITHIGGYGLILHMFDDCVSLPIITFAR